jgi:endonuclease YncB( thermonuclease family)
MTQIGSTRQGRPRGALLSTAAAGAIALLAIVPVAARDADRDVTTSSIEARNPDAGALAGREETRVRFLAHRTPLRDDSLAISVVSPGTGELAKVELPGLEAMSFNMICRGQDDLRSACGSKARVQLFNFLARKEITCILGGARGQGGAVVSCAVQGEDLATWIVRRGIARTLDPKAFVEAQRHAQSTRTGMWADAQTRSSFMVAGN